MHSSRMCTVAVTRCQYRGFSVQGVSVQRETPYPLNRMTDTSKNITLPKLRFQVLIMFQRWSTKLSF